MSGGKKIITKPEAAVAAERIERFWKSQGHSNVRAWVHECEVSNTDESGYSRRFRHFETRSNLINGLPPRV